jgi:PLP dependent protein
MADAARRIADNVVRIRERIAEAARRSGRSPDSVTLVAVTKSLPTEIVGYLIDASCTRLGESRPQELWAKTAALADRQVGWHMIGHLQRNKIRRTLPLVELVQSVDSLRLLEALDTEAAVIGRRVDALLEINISDDANKTGLPADELPGALGKAATLTHVAVRGLMGMASLEGGPDAAARDFARLRELRDQVDAPPGVSLAELSMGMSEDFEIAIAEGATIVRVGSALVEGIEI